MVQFRLYRFTLSKTNQCREKSASECGSWGETVGVLDQKEFGLNDKKTRVFPQIILNYTYTQVKLKVCEYERSNIA